MKMLDELRRERDVIDEVIAALERLAAGQGRRRGRPPTWLAKAAATTPVAATKKKVGRPRRSAKPDAGTGGE